VTAKTKAAPPPPTRKAVTEDPAKTTEATEPVETAKSTDATEAPDTAKAINANLADPATTYADEAVDAAGALDTAKPAGAVNPKPAAIAVADAAAKGGKAVDAAGGVEAGGDAEAIASEEAEPAPPEKSAKAQEADRAEGGKAADAAHGGKAVVTAEGGKAVDAAAGGRAGYAAEGGEASPRVRLAFRPSRRLVVAAFAVLLVAATATAVIQWRTAHRLSARDRTEQKVRDRSADFGRALLAYKYTDLSAARSRIGALTSSDFGSSYETAFDGLASVITKYKATATATVRDVYLNDFDGQRAKTLVVLDSEVKSTMGVRRVLGTKLLLQLILEKGSWRIDSMTTLAADDESLTKPDGTVERPQQDTATTQPTP